MDTNQDYWDYIIRCADGSYYTGSTHDLEQRLRAHEDGRAAPYTTRRRPLSLVYSEKRRSMKAARGRELQIKRWTRKKKEALIKGNVTGLKSLSKRKVT
jgi:predicted GIY-YIG superfamily endonuclease